MDVRALYEGDYIMHKNNIQDILDGVNLLIMKRINGS